MQQKLQEFIDLIDPESADWGIGGFGGRWEDGKMHCFNKNDSQDSTFPPRKLRVWYFAPENGRLEKEIPIVKRHECPLEKKAISKGNIVFLALIFKEIC